MSAKNTPGPLSIHAGECALVISEPTGNTVAEFSIDSESNREFFHGKHGVDRNLHLISAEEATANASLFLAAPELLEALKELVNSSAEFESVDSQKIGFLDCRNRLHASVERSLEAIAKAEGGAA